VRHHVREKKEAGEREVGLSAKMLLVKVLAVLRLPGPNNLLSNH